eukprot:NODE_89_length_21781_cov_0.895836.p18 type:complete len:144 gc:universal NODE_89_length_21781_cov_0.895836:2818-2387(-)
MIHFSRLNNSSDIYKLYQESDLLKVDKNEEWCIKVENNGYFSISNSIGYYLKVENDKLVQVNEIDTNLKHYWYIIPSPIKISNTFADVNHEFKAVGVREFDYINNVDVFKDKQLGEGTYSFVYLGEWQGKKIAVICEFKDTHG